MMETTETTVHKQPNYVAVFWSLLILTVCEIIAANLPLPKFPVVLLLVTLAIIKAALVALFYMHLKFEKYVIYIIVLFPLFLAVTLVVSVLFDRSIS